MRRLPLVALSRRSFLTAAAAGGAAVAFGEPLLRAAVERSLGRTLELAGSSTIAPAPPIIRRSEWGADETIGDRDRSFAPLVKAVVHHTAIEEQDPAAQVRGIHRTHVLVNGWSDIGYNFLVDREGRLYEGRWARDYAAGEVHDGEDGDGRLVMGAHATSHNRGVLGVAVLGNYTQDRLTAASLETLARLIAWKFALHDVSPNGASIYVLSSGQTEQFPNIAGHGDVDPPTTCPGPAIHQRLFDLRVDVGRRLVERRRIAGTDRYDTAALVAAETHPSAAATVFVASGEGFADALAAGAVVGRFEAPLLLTAPAAVPAATHAALRRLAPTRIVVVGGPAAVADAVIEELRAYTGDVARWAGTDRDDTAATLAERSGFTPGGAVVIVSSAQFADALAAGPLAVHLDAPVLAVGPAGVPARTADVLRSLKPEDAFVCGGTDAVTTEAERQLLGMVPNIHRLSGTDRYTTATAISAAQYPGGSDEVIVARGETFADALAVGPAAAAAGAPLLLVPQRSLPHPVAVELRRLGARKLTVVGGPAAITDTVEIAARDELAHVR